MSAAPDKSAIRDAATIVVVRDAATRPRVLMGQRGAKAAFMPDKFVFPGGAVDPQDRDVPLAGDMPQACTARLAQDCGGATPSAIAAAGIRELWEETGLILGVPGDWPSPPPPDWAGFAQRGFRPTADAMRFIFRAITPPKRPRRFDARFFLVMADALASPADDFSGAADELSHLQWIALEDTHTLDLPFITEVVLAEVEDLLAAGGCPDSVPFFRNSAACSEFLRLT